MPKVNCNHCGKTFNDLEVYDPKFRCGGLCVFTEIPKIICYCGSLRFKNVFQQVEYQSVLEGNIALLPCCMFVDIQREHGEASSYKKMADELHKRKIDICDEVFVLNVDGYIGDSTRSEIEYAKSISKPIVYLEPINQPPSR